RIIQKGLPALLPLLDDDRFAAVGGVLVVHLVLVLALLDRQVRVALEFSELARMPFGSVEPGPRALAKGSVAELQRDAQRVQVAHHVALGRADLASNVLGVAEQGLADAREADLGAAQGGEIQVDQAAGETLPVGQAKLEKRPG